MRYYIQVFILALATCLHLSHDQHKKTVYYFQHAFEDIDTIRHAELNRHNTLRARHGAPALEMNDELNRGAQAYAEKLVESLVLVHSQQGVGGHFGESLYYADAPLLTKISENWDYYQGRYDLVALPTYAATDKWYSQNTYYDYEYGLSSNGLAVGHFTAVVWKSCKEIGFGYGWRPNPTNPDNYLLVVVARYQPIPNIRGSYIENVLAPQK